MRVKFLLLALLPMVAMAQYRSEVWCPDNGDGTYTNPVINADYSDPDVCVAGDDFYMTASSFNCIPGLPILHSKDLVNWEIVGYALKKNIPDSVFSSPQHGNGVWAPSIRYHQGEFYIYWGDPDYGVYMVKTKNPSGTWDDPVLVIPGKGMIDTTPLWDEDGRCYLVNGWANSRIHFASVLSMRELSVDGTRAITDPVMVFDGWSTGNFTCEGPKLYKRNGYYYIMCPAGGVPSGWQLAMRSKSPYGPYEAKRVMAQGKTAINGPHQGGWVTTKTGEDWFMNFQDKGPYGRVVHLNPVHWVKDWPVMGIDKDGDLCGEPVSKYRKPNVGDSYPVCNPAESDEFNAPVLGKQWQWQANFRQEFGMPTPYGYIRLFTNKLSKQCANLWEAPNMMLQKTPADAFTVTAKVRMSAKIDGQFGGIICMGLDYSALVVKRISDHEFQLQQLTCKQADKGTAETVNVLASLRPTDVDKVPYQKGVYEDIYLRMTVTNGAKLQFSYSGDGKKFKDCGTAFQMREGKWIGAKVGLLSEEPYNEGNRGWLDVDWFRVTK
jgi:beta-xylosidase